MRATVRYKLKLWEVRVNLRVHNSVSRSGLIRSDYYTTSIFGSIGWGFAPDPTGGAYSAPPDPVVKMWEIARNGVPPSLPFLTG